MLVLGWYVLVTTDSVILLTAFGALGFIGTLVAPIFGMLGDRLGRRTMICFHARLLWVFGFRHYGSRHDRQPDTLFRSSALANGGFGADVRFGHAELTAWRHDAAGAFGARHWAGAHNAGHGAYFRRARRCRTVRGFRYRQHLYRRHRVLCLELPVVAGCGAIAHKAGRRVALARTQGRFRLYLEHAAPLGADVAGLLDQFRSLPVHAVSAALSRRRRSTRWRKEALACWLRPMHPAPLSGRF